MQSILCADFPTVVFLPVCASNSKKIRGVLDIFGIVWDAQQNKNAGILEDM
jgi:hypothetical protein